jgi:hypothetical protein
MPMKCTTHLSGLNAELCLIRHPSIIHRTEIYLSIYLSIYHLCNEIYLLKMYIIPEEQKRTGMKEARQQTDYI